VYRHLKGNWSDDMIGVVFLTKGRENNIDQYSIAIIKARELPKSHN